MIHWCFDVLGGRINVRKIVLLITALVVATTVQSYMFALTELIESIEDEPAKSKILDIIEPRLKEIYKEAERMNWTKEITKYGDYQKIYWIRENINEYYKTKKLNFLIDNSSIMWELPLYSDEDELISTIRAIKSPFREKWSYGSGNLTSAEIVKFYIDKENILSIINENNIKPISIKHVRLYTIKTDFYYITEGRNEYAVPMSLQPDTLGIDNYELYNMKDFIDKLSPFYIPLDQVKNNESVPKYGGISGTNYNWDKIFFVGFLVLSSLVGAIYLIKKIIKLNRI